MTGPALDHATWGAGPLVVALHGLGRRRPTGIRWPSSSVRSGWSLRTPLGFGRSPAPPDSAYDLDARLAALEPLLVEPATIVAHSTGCLLALSAAARWPEMVHRLVLSGLPAWPDRATALHEVGRLGATATDAAV